MKKKFLVIAVCSMVFALGSISVYAYSGNDIGPISLAMFKGDEKSIKQSNDNGVTWENYTESTTVDFYDEQEFSLWIEEQKKDIQKLVEAGEWTQEQADNTIQTYNELLREITDGVMVGKRSELEAEQTFYSLPDGMHTKGYQTAIFNGESYEYFGPFDTRKELFEALKEYTDSQIQLENMSQAEADELLQKYK